MDLQRAMEFVLEQEAKLNVQMQALTEKMDRLTGKMDGLTEKMDGLTERTLELEERHDREIADGRAATSELRAELRRAVRLSVQEHRNERVRRQELDQKITQLAAAQVITEEKLQRLIDTLNQPRNGHNQ